MFRKLFFAAALVASTGAPAAPAGQFLRQAVKGNYSEVVLGRLIASRGASNQVRNFGAMLVRDHSNGLAQARAIAARSGVRVTVALTPEARRERALLNRLRGVAFDREVRRYMINDHRHDIAEFRAQARTGDRATARFAAATLPILQHHLAVARSIRR